MAKSSDDGNSPPCNRPLSRASRLLFRQDASPILLHYFGGKDREAPWRRRIRNDGDGGDASFDKKGRRRERISMVDNPADGLTDEEWYELLGWAIDQSTSSSATNSDNPATPNICPLHPKHDVLLKNDRNSFLIQTRYRSAMTKFGAFSLPSHWAARTASWREERETYTQLHDHPPLSPRQISANSVFLFQCGFSEKTFVSRYYLDKYMETHHPTHGGDEIDSAGNQLLCPADHVCEALGGVSACVETMSAMAPHYGRGALLGKEYDAPAADSFFSTSISSLISHLNRGNDQTERVDDDPFPTKKRQMQTRQARREANLIKAIREKAIGEMRHRAWRRNKLMLQVALHRQRSLGENSSEEQLTVSEIFSDAALAEQEKNIENDLHPVPAASAASCDEKEMERLFHLCRNMMLTCFGDGAVDGAKRKVEENSHTLTNDLITQICEPLHCHHRLHRMAGHNSRHVVHWNDKWHEHHSFALGWLGWIGVLGLVMFYGCAYVAGVLDDDFGNSNLPNHRQKKGKPKYA